MSKYTPGPWKVVKDAFGFCINQRDDDDGNIRAIADIRKYAPGGGTAEGNARLIAAAPELLDALQEIEVFMGADFDDLPIASKARAAIAKATGETK